MFNDTVEGQKIISTRVRGHLTDYVGVRNMYMKLLFNGVRVTRGDPVDFPESGYKEINIAMNV